mmetsp:Transcript_22441/g.39701  ORF Transcript_22441/g.39701 Transcript_22441/m.39701 type:complete len:271 (-) Transcript_22441:54-866(-)
MRIFVSMGAWISLVSLVVKFAGGGWVGMWLWSLGTLPWVFDATYILEVIYRFARSFFASRKDKKKLTEWHSIEHMPLMFDIDYMYHLNNAKYNRKIEFARTQFMLDSGMYHVLKALKFKGGLGCVAVRFRRELKPFQRFTIRTRLAGWGEKSLYLEHRIVTLVEGNDPSGTLVEFTNAHAVSHYKISKRRALKAEQIVKAMDPDLVDSMPEGRVRAVSMLLQGFTDFEEASSNELKSRGPVDEIRCDRHNSTTRGDRGSPHRRTRKSRKS